MAQNQERSSAIYTNGVPLTNGGEPYLYLGFASKGDHLRYQKEQDLLKLRQVQEQQDALDAEARRVSRFAELVEARTEVLLTFHEKMWQVVEVFMELLDLSGAVEFSNDATDGRVYEGIYDLITDLIDKEEEIRINCVTELGRILRFSFSHKDSVQSVSVSIHSSMKNAGKQLLELSETDFSDDVPDPELLEFILTRALEDETFDPVQYLRELEAETDSFDPELWATWTDQGPE